MAYKQQKCVSRSSGGWQPWTGETALSGELALVGHRLFIMSSLGGSGGWGEGACAVTNLTGRGSTLTAESPPKGPTFQHYSLWVSGFQHMNLGVGTNIHTLVVGIPFYKNQGYK